MPLHDNKVAIVTGGAKGIGYATAERLLREGARLVVADIDDNAGLKAVDRLTEYGSIRYVHCNVSERLDVHNLIASTLEAFGDIDILVNNAGIVHKEDFLSLKADDFDRVLSVNLKGAFLISQLVARHMVEKIGGGLSIPGCIINISAVDAVCTIAEQLPYAVSKAGMNQLTKVMALALADYGIRVNAVAPGSIMTDMMSTVLGDNVEKNKVLSRTPLGRLGKPEEIASLISFLASGEASYVTGQTLYADGGRLGLNLTVPVHDDE